MKKLAKRILRSIGLDIRAYSPFMRAIDRLKRKHPDAFFIQVGANNGIDFDEFYGAVMEHNLEGVVVEPVPYYFDTLKEVYKLYPGIIPARVALHPTLKAATMYRVAPAAVREPWQHGLASFFKEHITKDGRFKDTEVVEDHVECLTFTELVERFGGGRRIDIVTVDAEGLDIEIVNMIDLKTMNSAIIRFEWRHEKKDDLDVLIAKLKTAGYKIIMHKFDCIALKI